MFVILAFSVIGMTKILAIIPTGRVAQLANRKYLKYVDADDLIHPHGLDVMVRGMEKFPDAGFGICKPEHFNDQKPYPIELTPEVIPGTSVGTGTVHVCGQGSPS